MTPIKAIQSRTLTRIPITPNIILSARTLPVIILPVMFEDDKADIVSYRFFILVCNE